MRALIGNSRPSLWDVAIAVLGLNVWTSFNLIPALHQDGAAVPTFWLLASVPLLALATGGLLRSRAMLLGAFPVALVLPVIVDPRIVGVNVYTPWSFFLVAGSFLAYTFGTAVLLEVMARPAQPPDRKRMPPVTPSARQRRRRRMYVAYAALASLYPLVLLSALYLDDGIQSALRKHYPERAPQAAVLFGAVAIGLWLLLFYRYFYTPLRTHIRGDRATKADLVVLRHDLRRGRPRPQFYIWVVLALGMMALLYLAR